MTEKSLQLKRFDFLSGAMLFSLLLLLYIVFLGVRPLFIPDEVRYGEIAREMLVTGDWIVPRLNGLLYFEKPPFGHWMNAASLFLFGENPFAVRFASVFSTAISALTVFYLGHLLFESRRIALFAVFIFLTTFEVQAIGVFSVLDPAFAMALNLGIAAFVSATMSDGRRRVAALVVSGAFFGVAFLAKGFLALALPVLVLGPWLIYKKELHLLFVQSWLAVIAAAAVIAPWAIAIHLREPDFWHYFFWVEHIQRFGAENAQHKAPIYYYLMYLPAVAFPWIYLLPAAVEAYRKGGTATANRLPMALIALWAVIPLLFFSVASGKLITYILPCFVPLSLLLAAGLSRIDTGARSLRYGLRAAAVFPTILLVAVVYVSFIAQGLPSYGDDETAKLTALMMALFACAGILLYASFNARDSRVFLAPGIAITVLLVGLPWLIPATSLEHKAPVAFIEESAAHLPADTIVVTNGSLVRAVSWALKRSDIYVIDNGGETTYGLNAPDASGRFLDGIAFTRMIESSANVLLICKGSCSANTMRRLPPNAKASTFGNFNAFSMQRAAKR